MPQRLLLSPPFDTLWQGKDPFAEAFALKGKVYRELESRRTLRIEVNGKGYFAKLHSGCGWWPIMKEWLRLRRPVLGAQTEYAALSLLRSIGVSTMRPVAFGMQGANPATQCSFLITEELTDTVDLETHCKQWQTDPPTAQHKRALIKAVAQITRTMHAAGMNHRDLYLVHFLLHGSESESGNDGDRSGSSSSADNRLTLGGPAEENPTPRISLIDLHRAQIRKHLPKRWRDKDLAALAYSSHAVGLSRADQVRFLKEYFQEPLRVVLAQEYRTLRFLETETKRLKGRWNRRFEAGTMATIGHNPPLWINPDSEAFLKECGLDRYTLFHNLWNYQAELIEPGNTSRGGFSGVTKIALGPPGNERNFFLKRQENHLFYSLTYPFGAPTFLRELIYLVKLEKRDVPVVRPIAYGARHTGGKKRAFLLTEKQQGTQSRKGDYTLKSGKRIALETYLRTLPNKRITATAIYQGSEVIAKLFLGSDWFTKQAREQNGLALLSMAGLPCPEIIASEPLANNAGGVLIIQKIENATPLSELLSNNVSNDVLERWIECLLALHRAGLVHGDPHLDNFLLDPQEILWVIDGERVRKEESPERRLDNFALALAQIPAALHDQLNAFLNRHEITAHYGASINLQESIQRAYNRRMSEIIQKVGRNSSLCSLRPSLLERLASEPSFLDIAQRISEDPDGWLDCSDILKAGNSSTLGRITIDDRDVVIKRYNIKNVWHWLRRLGKTTRAWHSWEVGHILKYCGVPTACSLAVIERRFGPFHGPSWLIMENVKGEPLANLYPADGPPFDQTMQDAITVFFRKLMNSRIYQGDMKASNLLWSKDRLIMVDLDACVRKSWPIAFDPWFRKMVIRFANNWPDQSPNNVWCMTNLMHPQQSNR